MAALGPGHPRIAQRPFLSRDPELCVGRPIAIVAIAALDDLKEEPVAIEGGIKLEVFSSRLVAVVEDVVRPEPVDEGVIEPEARLDIGEIVGRDGESSPVAALKLFSARLWFRSQRPGPKSLF